MDHTKEDVNGIATKTFANYTPSKLKSILKSVIPHLQTISIDSFTINCFGGIGDGKDNKYRACYLTNSEYNAHLKGLNEFESILGIDNFLSIYFYRNNCIVLKQMIDRLEHLSSHALELSEINQKLQQTSSYQSIDDLFDECMTSSFCCNFFCDANFFPQVWMVHIYRLQQQQD